MSKKPAVQGNCFMCGKTAAKVAMKNHLLKDHTNGNELCRLILAEGAYDNDYWILFSIAADASMADVDKFLRLIWCECCGHMSQFHGAGKSTKIAALTIGQKIAYEYDMGSTTAIVLTFHGEISRPKQKEKVCLLARNAPLEEVCDTCGAPATFINAWEGALVCDKCSRDAEDEAAILPFVNSPRAGECGFEGELDRWTFDPKKPFPQIPPTPQRRRGVRVRED